jgi:hypothetical protein
MKTMTRSNVYLPMAAMILMAAFALPAAAQKQVPFKGMFYGQDAHDTPLPPGATTVVIRTITAGNGTGHLNRFLLVREITGDLLTLTHTGSAQWIAGNGDSIDTTVVAVRPAVLSDNGDYFIFTETHTITGGTGRFKGAQGSFEVELMHRLERSGVAGGFETHDASGSFQGIITLTGAAH